MATNIRNIRFSFLCCTFISFFFSAIPSIGYPMGREGGAEDYCEDYTGCRGFSETRDVIMGTGEITHYNAIHQKLAQYELDVLSEDLKANPKSTRNVCFAGVTFVTEKNGQEEKRYFDVTGDGSNLPQVFESGSEGSKPLVLPKDSNGEARFSIRNDGDRRHKDDFIQAVNNSRCLWCRNNSLAQKNDLSEREIPIYKDLDRLIEKRKQMEREFKNQIVAFKERLDQQKEQFDRQFEEVMQTVAIDEFIEVSRSVFTPSKDSRDSGKNIQKGSGSQKKKILKSEDNNTNKTEDSIVSEGSLNESPELWGGYSKLTGLISQQEKGYKSDISAFLKYFWHSEQRLIDFLLTPEKSKEWWDQIVGDLSGLKIKQLILHVHSTRDLCLTCRAALSRLTRDSGLLIHRVTEQMQDFCTVSEDLVVRILASFRLRYMFQPNDERQEKWSSLRIKNHVIVPFDPPLGRGLQRYLPDVLEPKIYLMRVMLNADDERKTEAEYQEAFVEQAEDSRKILAQEQGLSQEETDKHIHRIGQAAIVMEEMAQQFQRCSEHYWNIVASFNH